MKKAELQQQLVERDEQLANTRKWLDAANEKIRTQELNRLIKLAREGLIEVGAHNLLNGMEVVVDRPGEYDTGIEGWGGPFTRVSSAMTVHVKLDLRMDPNVIAALADRLQPDPVTNSVAGPLAA